MAAAARSVQGESHRRQIQWRAALDPRVDGLASRRERAPPLPATTRPRSYSPREGAAIDPVGRVAPRIHAGGPPRSTGRPPSPAPPPTLVRMVRGLRKGHNHRHRPPSPRPPTHRLISRREEEEVRDIYMREEKIRLS